MMRTPRDDHRLSDPNNKITGHLDDRLVHLLEEASRFLPPGWRLEVTSGHRAGATVAGGGRSQHASGLAIDVQLVDPQGRYVANKTALQSGGIWDEYKKLADLVFHCQRLLYPGLEGRLCWGGKFTLPSGEWDVMHFDLGGMRGRGRYQPPDSEAIPERLRAELGGGDEPPAAA
jgi:D-alanyl-D-alanine carboxypeptidase